ncbi:hypothetical protein HPB48_004661 [Haemaphysalis longicornis]|uniref:EF-hand domain-containing protein n=1 Tax=Haemaphysalis longicornis TaxID=44386 RepID=A0A9J6FZJ0_HAELO|nr:hypothetical protein HPB48_004661 [Haemaphysalis longicornis]
MRAHVEAILAFSFLLLSFRYRHAHFSRPCPASGTGICTRFIIFGNYTKLQRHGKLEKEVFERWKSILERWWNELTEHADFNKDRIVEFDEWLKFFTNLGKSTKSVKDLPDFLQKYLHLFFLIMDSNKDGLVCAKDYKKYLKTHNLDISRADECFKAMLTSSFPHPLLIEQAVLVATSLVATPFLRPSVHNKVSLNETQPQCGPFAWSAVHSLTMLPLTYR